MRVGSQRRWPVLTMVSGTAISCDVSRRRGERPSNEKRRGYGPAAARAHPPASAATRTTAAARASKENRIIGELSNRVIDYQITRLHNYPIARLAHCLSSSSVFADEGRTNTLRRGGGIGESFPLTDRHRISLRSPSGARSSTEKSIALD